MIFNGNMLNKISISIHSFEANLMSESYEEYLNNILNFVTEIRKSNDTYCCLRLWNVKNTKDNTLNSDIIEKIEKHFDVDVFSQINNLKNIKLANRVFLQLDEAFDWPDIDIDDVNNTGFCYGLRDHFSVLADGTVVPCCLDNNGEINLGNIFCTSLIDILQSNRAKNIFDNFSNRKIVEPLCKKCNYIKKFSKKH
ncbi:MAG: SPASM domain-containing protein [Clostridia bacterium]